MNRRTFLSLLGLGVGGLAIDQAIPLGRVWSFPKKIVVPKFECQDDYFQFDEATKIGTTIRIRIPQRFIVRDYIGDFSKPPQWRDEIYCGLPPG